MRLARTSHERFEQFFRVFFDDRQFVLPVTRVYYGGFARLLTALFNLNGITFGSRIFIHPKFTRRDAAGRLYASKALIAHEIAHVRQFHQIGFFNFFYVYLKGYWEALRKKEKWDLAARTEAYLEIPLEAEARAFAAGFLNDLEIKRHARRSDTPIFPSSD